MKRWPFRRHTETRQAAQPFTDAIVSAIAAQAAGTTTGDPTAIAALEVAAGLYARSFAAATIEPEGLADTVTADVRASIARELIRRGESVHLIEVDRGAVRLTPVGSWDIAGPADPSAWWYRADTFGPSGNLSRRVPGSAVVHCRYAHDPATPWLGVSPLGWARATGTLAANLETRLGEETGGTVAHVLPVPQDGGDGSADDPLADLKTDIRNAKGGTVLTETTSAGWGEGRAVAPAQDWQPKRIGANPPAVLPGLRADVFAAVLNACGVPAALALANADGTAQRESFRRFLTTGLEPVGELVAAELSAKLEAGPVRFDFTNTYAHDLAGRAAAFGKLIQGGMDLPTAVAVAGLAVSDE